MSYEKKQVIYKSIMLVVLTAFITFLGTTLAYYKIFDKEGLADSTLVPASYQDHMSKLNSKILSVKKVIDQSYLGEIDEDKLISAAVKGYVQGLGDPYTVYMTEEEWEEFRIDTMGNYTGIGIYMKLDKEDNSIVIEPMKDSPAYEAGLRKDDVILKVDGVEYTGEQMDQASNKIKGVEGTKVKLEIRRDDKILEFEIERKTIKINHIESEVLNNNIGYIKLSSFDENCSQEFESEYNELKDKKIKSLVVDLRDNTGGLVNEALNVIDLFIEKGEISLITVDKSNKEDIRKAKKGIVIDVPVVLLVNEYSASATEIVAGALKDHNKVTIVGKQTYGKGVIQELKTLKDGSAVKVTIDEWFTPKYNKINGVGIAPDEVVELSEEAKKMIEIPLEQDAQLKKAIEILSKK